MFKLDETLSERTVRNMDVDKLFLKACTLIDEHISLEVDFAKRALSVVKRMLELRNERGDISHGRAIPKIKISSNKTAAMIMQVTDSIVSYILDAFFSIDLSYKDEIKYEDNPVFNEFLDDDNSTGSVIYSKALFDQDIVAYEEQLDTYMYYQYEREEIMDKQKEDEECYLDELEEKEEAFISENGIK